MAPATVPGWPLGGAAVRPLQDGLSPGVEDAAAITALVAQDRSPMAMVHPQTLALTACGTGQTKGVESIDELAVADVLVQIVDEGKSMTVPSV